jgi:O-antigen ligase
MLLSPNTYLALLGVILAFRLGIWQLFPTMDAPFREGFSDVALAILICSLAMPWLLGKIRHKQPVKTSGLELPLILFFTAAVFSLFYTVDFPSTLRAVLVMGAGIVLFYMLLDLLDSPARLRYILIFIMYIAVAASVFGVITFFEYAGHHHTKKDAELQLTSNGLAYLLAHPRAVSFFGWPNTLAGFQLLFLPLALVLPFYLQKTWQKGMAIGALLVFMACFLLTFSFLGWMSFLLSSIVLLPYFRQKIKFNIWPVVIIFLVLFVLVILRKDFLGSLSPRIFYYKAAFLLLMQKPILGWGFNTFGLMSSPLTQNKFILSAFVHNSYLQVWVELGIIGFAGIAALGILVFKKAHAAVYTSSQAKDHWLKVAIAWGIIAFLIDNLFSFTMLQSSVALFWWAMLAVLCAGEARHPETPTGHPERSEGSLSTLQKPIAFIVILIMFITLARLTGGYALYYQAKKNADYSNPIFALGSCSNGIKAIGRAQALDPWSSYLPAAAGEFHMKLFEFTRLKAMLMMARADYLKAIQLSPHYYYNYFVVGKIDGALGELSQEQKYTQKAKELSPAEFALDTEMFNKSAAQ